jgi:hypothetical protein
MKLTLIVLVAIFSAVAFVGVTSYVSAYNYGNEAEKSIKAEYANLSNVLGNYTTSIKEAGQIPAMQTEDLERLFTGSLEARYGADGSQAAMQWIREQNPNLDQSTYLKIQQMIEAGRNKFENHQQRFLDTLRVYETNRGYLWTGFWLRVAGYPTQEFVDADYKIVTSSHARESFETGIDDGVQLR